MIVDDAIVVIENIQRQRALGLKPFAASVMGTRQVFFAVLATTATLISVFLPIAFLPSTAGKLFHGIRIRAGGCGRYFVIRRSFALPDVGIPLARFWRRG